MVRHVRPFKRVVDYGTKHNIELKEAGAVIYSSDMRYSQLPTIANKCRSPLVYSLIAPNRDDHVHLLPKGYIMVYRNN